MRITIFSLGGLLGQYVTNTALLHGAQVTAYVPDAKAIWPRKNLTVIEGSLQNRERVLEALLFQPDSGEPALHFVLFFPILIEKYVLRKFPHFQ